MVGDNVKCSLLVGDPYCWPDFIRFSFAMFLFFFRLLGLVSLAFDDFADCFCMLKIVDQSYQKPGLSVNVFAEHFGALPHVAALGDIVQLSHVMVFPCIGNMICKMCQLYFKCILFFNRLFLL